MTEDPPEVAEEAEVPPLLAADADDDTLCDDADVVVLTVADPIVCPVAVLSLDVAVLSLEVAVLSLEVAVCVVLEVEGVQ